MRTRARHRAGLAGRTPNRVMTIAAVMAQLRHPARSPAPYAWLASVSRALPTPSRKYHSRLNSCTHHRVALAGCLHLSTPPYMHAWLDAQQDDKQLMLACSASMCPRWLSTYAWGPRARHAGMHTAQCAP